MDDSKNYVERGMEIILQGLKEEFGLEADGQHFIGTPKRVAKAYREIFAGLKDTDEQVEKILSTA